jgi:redox-sensitive bicupin YhaK (pirin superfamily)
VARGMVSANGQRLDAGDALRITDQSTVHLSGGQDAEVLVFDLPPAA